MDEQELVEGLRERRESAVTTFLERYRSLFHHCIGHFESDHAAREDLYQDLVVYVLDRIDQGRFDATKGSFGTWLYRVAWCRCVDLKRRESSRRALKMDTGAAELPDQEDDGPGPDQVVLESEMGGIVHEALGFLEREERSLLGLRYLEGATLGEIARQLSISIEQTKYRLRRATVSLRRVLLNQMAVEEPSE